MAPHREPLRAGPSAELAEETLRQVALHAPPQLPAGKPAFEARLARRLQTLLDLIDDVGGSRPPEPGHQRPRQRVVVLDASDRLPVDDDPSRHVRQRQREGLRRLVVHVVQDRHPDRLRQLTGQERERPARGRVVGARPCAPVHGGVVDADRPARGPVQGHLEVDRAIRVLRGSRVRHRESRVATRSAFAGEVHLGAGVQLRVDGLLELAQGGGNLPGQPVVVEFQLREVREVAQGGRNPAGKTVPAEAHRGEIREPAQRRRYGERQVVRVEKQVLQVREVAQRRRYRSRQSIVVEIQAPQVRKVAERRRYRSGQRIVRKGQ